MTKPIFRYLDLRKLGPVGARGTTVRLTLLTLNIPYEEQLVSLSDWQKGEQARTIEADINPGGYLPSVFINGKWYPEAVAVSRYFCRQKGVYGSNAEADYEMDAAADAYQGWRNMWVKSLGNAADHPDVVAYKGKREHFFSQMEWFYAHRTATDSPFLAEGDIPSFADCAAFNIVRDDGLVYGDMDMGKYPNLDAAYKAVGAIAAVQDWIKMWTERTDF